MKTTKLSLYSFLLILLFSCKIESQSEQTETVTKNEFGEIIYSENGVSIRGVKTIPAEVFGHLHLKYLSVWGQDCDVVGKGFECLAITEIPKEIANLGRLEELHLTLNYITKLPKEILELKNLSVLDLTENPGFDDVETVCKMTWLKEFSCYGCHLSEEEIEKLRLNLPDCKFGV